MFNPPSKYWNIKHPGDPADVEHLVKVLGVHRVVANLLVQRGMHTFDEAKAFFRPQLSDLHDPFLMLDMEKAVKRIREAIEKKEKIMIYGDYDVDGTTSVAMMYLFLKSRYDQLDYYVPNRYNEGYGVSYKGIDYAGQQDIRLIIALDCGIKAVEKVQYAKAKNIDFIICDHHTAGNQVPEAVAVLDPKRPGCAYPYKELSGCGVGFKLIQAYSMVNGIPFEELIPYLDLLCVSIASDIVPVTGENRILSYYGLKQLNTNPRTGLKAILRKAGILDKEIAIDDIVFKIGPRINAAGRIESGRSSVDLLISENDILAGEMGELINDYNNTRKNIDNTITKEALNLIGNNRELLNRKSTVLFNPGWHKGVIGIVASRLIETFYRPTIVLTESNGFITGSARSVPGFDLYHALENCSDLLETFGGHMYAAGLTLKKDALKAFQDRFEQVVTDSIEPDQLIPRLDIDAELKFNEINQKLYNHVKQFQPFGPGNMSPVFFTENVSDNGTGRKVGTGEEHLKLSLVSEDRPYPEIPAIGFGLAHVLSKIKDETDFDICYCLDENTFRDTTTIQLRIKDIKFDKIK